MADHQFLVHLTKDSTVTDVGDWLRERGFDEVVISNFEGKFTIYVCKC